MEMIKFELPEKLWKVTKTYLTHEYDAETAQIILDKSTSWYFKNKDLALEFIERFKEESWEFVEIFKYDEYSSGEHLRVIAYIEEIETVNLIPNVVDL